MTKRKILIDTDPGIDDVLAIATAYCIDSLDIVALSSVKGNVSLEYTTRNAILTLDILKQNTPVYKGSKEPLVNSPVRNSNVHGSDGLGNLYDSYREATPPIDRKTGGLYDLAEYISQSEDKITIIAIGPLTNIAKLLMINPHLNEKIEAIYIMGGGLKKGNVTDLAEFNFYCDAYAAQKVLLSGIDIYLSALDATTQVYFTYEEFDAYAVKNNQSEFIKKTLEYYINLDPYLHDVLAVLSLSDPQLFEFKKMNLNVLTSADSANGMVYESELKNNGNVYFVDVKSRENVVKRVFDIINTYNDR